MHPYAGQDPISINPLIPGKGVWPDPDVPDDDNDRDAANYSISVEGALDRTNWIGWRMVNGLEGNTSGAPYPGNIWWSGNHTGTGTWTLSTIAAKVGGSTMTGNWTVGGNWTASGAWTFSGVVAMTNVLVRSGDDAYTEWRGEDGPDAGSGGTPQDVNWWNAEFWLADISASRVWKLLAPPAGGSKRVLFVTVRIKATFAATTLELRNPANAAIVTLGDTGPKAVTLAFYLGNFYVVGTSSV